MEHQPHPKDSFTLLVGALDAPSGLRAQDQSILVAAVGTDPDALTNNPRSDLEMLLSIDCLDHDLRD